MATIIPHGMATCMITTVTIEHLLQRLAIAIFVTTYGAMVWLWRSMGTVYAP